MLTRAMKEKNDMVLSVMRSVLTGITRKLGELGEKPHALLEDKEVVRVVRALVKQRKEAYDAYTQAGRTAQAEQEKQEGVVLTRLLPPPPTEQEIQDIIDREIRTGGETLNKGVLIGAVMRAVGDSADGTVVRALIEKNFKTRNGG